MDDRLGWVCLGLSLYVGTSTMTDIYLFLTPLVGRRTPHDLESETFHPSLPFSCVCSFSLSSSLSLVFRILRLQRSNDSEFPVVGSLLQSLWFRLLVSTPVSSDHGPDYV